MPASKIIILLGQSLCNNGQIKLKAYRIVHFLVVPAKVAEQLENGTTR